MNNYFQLILDDFKKLWGGLEWTQKIAIVGLLIATIGALTFFVTKSTEPNWSVLYSDLQETDTAAIVESLKKNGYRYKVSDDRKSILVPVSDKESLRIFVAENELIKDSAPGFELLDKVQLGATDFQNKLTRQRIFQGELTRTIERINGIEKVRIQIAEPERSVFADNDEAPSASVMLIVTPGYRIKSQQIKAIKNLVAYGVPRLTPDRVFVSDQNGEVLSDDINKNSNDIESYKTNFEKKSAKKIVEVLEKIVGKDNVSVQVSADINFDSAQATIEKYMPIEGSTDGVVASSQSEVEVYDKGQKPQTTGNDATANINQKSMNYEKRKVFSNYNVSKEIKQVVYAPGTVKRMTVAVAVNKILTDEEKAELQDLVISASGMDMERGDIVKITSMEFASLSEDNAESEQLLKQAEMQAKYDFWITKVAPLVVVLVLGLIALYILGSMFKRTSLKTQSVGFGENINEEDDLETIDAESQQMMDIAQMPVIEAKLAPELEMMKSQLNNMIMNDPADASKLLLSFIKD